MGLGAGRPAEEVREWKVPEGIFMEEWELEEWELGPRKELEEERKDEPEERKEEDEWELEECPLGGMVVPSFFHICSLKGF